MILAHRNRIGKASGRVAQRSKAVIRRTRNMPEVLLLANFAGRVPPDRRVGLLITDKLGIHDQVLVEVELRPANSRMGPEQVTKRALITGITGQDGSYLAELLLAKGYEVHGIIRRASTFNTARIDHLYSDPHAEDARLFLHYGDLSDGARLVTLLAEVEPDEVYNLAAQSHVRVSFDEPVHTTDTTGTAQSGFLRLFAWPG